MLELLRDRLFPYPPLDQGEETVKTEDEAEALALADFIRAEGRVFRAEWVSGYEGDDSRDYYPEGGVLVRVRPRRRRPGWERDDIIRWMDEHLDPCWDVDIIEPGKLPPDACSFWVYAKSYHHDPT
jgi:hypothetical protein